MTTPKNGTLLWMFTGLLTAFVSLLTWVGTGYTDDVDLNTSAREQMVGAEVQTRLSAVEEKVEGVRDDVVILKVRQEYDRKLLESIAEATKAKTPPVTPVAVDNTSG